MTLKDKISEIIISVYNMGLNSTRENWGISDYATDRIMELIEEEKKDNE